MVGGAVADEINKAAMWEDILGITSTKGKIESKGEGIATGEGRN